ncbi:hypothetical protein P153DRAFT_401047 [Dothidotthia symphoricarpi CBS 119687]|uniref:Uncharacterized protein n=1 Tax=Dothidotthia symphoricarpi CBS 119687 TaxID=1392245 RepID=A0A6A5ZXX4_9PLEO|nr:uncharacterized protein P153DRAFT_401047 [Dothidotthia symphoricarpi CBS 119687]KAF2124430.1 hypothetical protein P153DRAFT_401047 [Dothidotthia symphoricarpi CBS 119687]
MCLYHYIYFSTCQHAELSKVTYCDTAISLGLHKRDSHLSRGVSAANHPPGRHGPLPTPRPTHPANNNSSSNSYSQQHHHSMSTLTPFEIGAPLAWDVAAAKRDERLDQHAAYIPRSVLKDGVVISRENNIAHASSLLNTPDFRTLNIDISIDTRPSLPVELTHDVPHHDLVRTSTKSTRRPSDLDSETVRGSHDARARIHADRYTVGHSGQGSRSPRKSIPTHWLPKSSGPNLATAQRARVRDGKKGSQGGSPIEVKTLRGTRSSIDLARMHAAEGATFLTKETLAAVENNLTSPSLAHSPTKLRHTTSKATLKSPAGSPIRSSPRQQGTLSVKTSPTRISFLSTDPASSDHKRAPSSIVSSSGRASFHTADGSPVRSPADSELSFESAVEFLDNVHLPVSDVKANSEDDQIKSSGRFSTSPTKAKPKLTLDTACDTLAFTDLNSATTSASTASSGDDFCQGSSPTSPLQASRIPRMLAANKSGSARDSKPASALKQSKSAYATSPQQTKPQQELPMESRGAPRHVGPRTVFPRHVRTLNSSGSTPILSRHRTIEKLSCSNATDLSTCTTVQQVENQADEVQAHSSRKKETHAHTQSMFASSDCIGTSSQASRASSGSTIKVGSNIEDFAHANPVVISDRKRSDAYGTILDRPLHISPLIVMVTHIVDIGSGYSNDVHDDTASVTSSHATVITHNISPVRGRSAQYVPNDRKHADGVRSMDSSLASELRATAREFIPGVSQVSKDNNALAGEATPVQLGESSVMPNFYTLDSYGVPCLYYMYPVPYVYPPGFGKGRAKSPRKFRPRKQRPTALEHTEPQYCATLAEIAEASNTREAEPELRQASPSPEHRLLDVCVPELLQVSQRQSSAPTHTAHSLKPSAQAVSLEPEDRFLTNHSTVPFACQMDFITRQAAIRNKDNGNTKHSPPPDVDLTTIRNVGIPKGPRSMRSGHNTLPSRRPYRSNGLYGGRAAVGVPMYATAPFPDAVAPMGRPDQYLGYTVGSDACGRVDIDVAAERGGGPACNACDPDH